METNFTPWNDTLEIMGDALEELEREEANRERPEEPMTPEILEEMAQRC